MPTAALAAAAVLVAFASVQLTGAQPLGALVLLAGVAVCVVREVRRRTGAWRLVVAVLAGGAAFVGSHVAADAIGPWPAVGLAAAVVGAVTYLLVDRRRPER